MSATYHLPLGSQTYQQNLLISKSKSIKQLIKWLIQRKYTCRPGESELTNVNLKCNFKCNKLMLELLYKIVTKNSTALARSHIYIRVKWLFLVPKYSWFLKILAPYTVIFLEQGQKPKLQEITFWDKNHLYARTKKSSIKKLLSTSTEI